MSNFKAILIILVLTYALLISCGGEEELPTEVVKLALDEGEMTIPATIDVPKGTTASSWGPHQPVMVHKKGTAFAVQIWETEEDYLEKLAERLAKEEGVTILKLILKQEESLLVWSSTREKVGPARRAGIHFRYIVNLKGKLWKCEGDSDFDQKLIDRQVEACKSLAAK